MYFRRIEAAAGYVQRRRKLAIRILSTDFELLNKKFVNRIRLPAVRVAV